MVHVSDYAFCIRLIFNVFYSCSFVVVTRIIATVDFLRAAALWGKLEGWCLENHHALGRDILKTLNSGVNHCEGRFRSLSPSHEAIHGMEAICAFHDGQEDPSSFGSSLPSLFGAVGAYNEYKCMFFKPSNIAEDTAIPSSLGNLHICTFDIFHNGGRNQSFVLIEEDTGKLQLMKGIPPLIPCISSSIKETLYSGSKVKSSSEMIFWMEEYVRRLTEHEFEVGRLVHDHMAILQYPAVSHRQSSKIAQGKSPVVSRAVTRGIEVIASSVFDNGLHPKHIYSIRIQLLGQNDEGYVSASERGFETCQLISRHWKLRNDEDGSVDQVDGDGVIGQYPLLKEGGFRDDQGNSANHVGKGREVDGIFRYQSCSNEMNGSFEGKLLFVPGSIEDPKGERFFVDVAPFVLTTDPDYRFF